MSFTYIVIITNFDLHDLNTTIGSLRWKKLRFFVKIIDAIFGIFRVKLGGLDMKTGKTAKFIKINLYMTIPKHNLCYNFSGVFSCKSGNFQRFIQSQQLWTQSLENSGLIRVHDDFLKKFKII